MTLLHPSGLLLAAGTVPSDDDIVNSVVNFLNITCLLYLLIPQLTAGCRVCVWCEEAPRAPKKKVRCGCGNSLQTEAGLAAEARGVAHVVREVEHVELVLPGLPGGAARGQVHVARGAGALAWRGCRYALPIFLSAHR